MHLVGLQADVCLCAAADNEALAADLLGLLRVGDAQAVGVALAVLGGVDGVAVLLRTGVGLGRGDQRPVRAGRSSAWLHRPTGT